MKKPKRNLSVWLDEPMSTQIDELRSQRRPIGSEAELVRELLDLGIKAYVAQQRRKEKTAAAVEAR